MKLTIKEICQRAGISDYLARKRLSNIPHTSTVATNTSPAVHDVPDEHLTYLLKKPNYLQAKNLLTIGEIAKKVGVAAPIITNRFKQMGVEPVAECPVRHCRLYQANVHTLKVAVTDRTAFRHKSSKPREVTSQDGANILAMEKEKQGWIGKLGCFVTPDGKQEYAKGIITKVSMIACYIGDQMGHLKFLRLLEQPA